MSENPKSKDSFLTLAEPAAGMYKVKGSKHFGYVFPLNTEDEVDGHLKSLRKKYHDARHHAYAYRLGINGDTWRTSDDGEPSNSAGPPILGAFKSMNVTNCLGVVIRYFGGTKLGVGGLIEAYRTATRYALEAAELKEEVILTTFKVSFPYDLMGTIMNHVDKWQAKPTEQIFLESCTIIVEIRRGQADAFERASQGIFGTAIERV